MPIQKVLPPVQPLTLNDIYIQEARIRVGHNAQLASTYKNAHDQFDRHVATLLSRHTINEDKLGAIAFTYSSATSSRFNLPFDS
jgi:hypothetical protein